MKIKVFGDAIIMVSALTLAQFQEADRFVPDSLTLVKVDEDGDKEPICKLSYNANSIGASGKFGITYNSVDEGGFMTVTGLGKGPDAADKKVKVVTEHYANLILNMNDLETQVIAALADNAARIETAKASVEVIG